MMIRQPAVSEAVDHGRLNNLGQPFKPTLAFIFCEWKLCHMVGTTSAEIGFLRKDKAHAHRAKQLPVSLFLHNEELGQYMYHAALLANPI